MISYHIKQLTKEVIMDKTKSLADILKQFGNPLEEQELLKKGLAMYAVALKEKHNNNNKDNGNDTKNKELL
jgi:hypothetical protein